MAKGHHRPSEGSVGLQSYALIYPTEAVLNEAIAKVEALEVKVEISSRMDL